MIFMATVEVEITIPARDFLDGSIPENPEELEIRIANCLNLPAKYVKIKR